MGSHGQKVQNEFSATPDIIAFNLTNPLNETTIDPAAYASSSATANFVTPAATAANIHSVLSGNNDGLTGINSGEARGLVEDTNGTVMNNLNRGGVTTV